VVREGQHAFVHDSPRAAERRLTRELSVDGAGAKPFGGTLELLRLVEDHLPPLAPPDNSSPST
jgi:hypothetical protein